MVKTDTNVWRFFRRSTAAGLVLLLILVGWPPTAAAKIKSNWSKVQKVAPGTKTTVVLYKDQAPRGTLGKSKVKGHFHSATAESITLTLNRGQTRTVQKQAVHKVLVDRPPYEGWITAGASTALFLRLAPGWDLNSRGWALFGGLFVGVPTGIAFLLAPKMKGVYNVPRRLRDDVVPTPKPDTEDLDTTASGVTEASTEHTGAGAGDRFLNGKSDPELPRWQARRAVMRQDLPLNLSSRPVHAHSSGND